MKLKYGLLAYALLLALLPTIVFASTITTAKYRGIVVVTSNGTAPTSGVIGYTANTSAMVSDGWVSANITDFALRDGITDVNFMPTADTWWFFLPSIPNASIQSLDLYTGGGTSMDGALRYIPGAAGMTTAYSADLQPTDNFSIELKGYFDTAQVGGNYVNQPLTVKDTNYSARLYVSANNTITWMQTGSGWTIAATVTPGLYTITVTGDSTNTTLYVDGAAQESHSITAISGSTLDWYFLETATAAANPMPYMEYLKFYKGGVLKQYIIWQYASTFTDQSGNGNDATPTFPTSGTSANITAALQSLSPISPAQISSYSVTTPSSILSANATMPSQMYTDETYTNIPGADVVNDFIDAGGYPRALWWYPFIYGVIAVLSLLFYPVTSGGNKTVLFQAIIVEFLLILVGVMNPVPLLAAFLFPIAIMGIMTYEGSLMSK